MTKAAQGLDYCDVEYRQRSPDLVGMTKLAQELNYCDMNRPAVWDAAVRFA